MFQGPRSQPAISNQVSPPSEKGFTIMPNPFQGSTILQFSINKEQQVSLSVYNMIGKKVSELCNRTLPAGTNRLTFMAGDLPKGTYLVKLVTNGETFTKKIVIK
jgi:hypothetical protein